MPDEQTPQLSWHEVAAQGEKPSPRSGHSLSVCGHSAYLFGGCDKKPKGTKPGWVRRSNVGNPQ